MRALFILAICLVAPASATAGTDDLAITGVTVVDVTHAGHSRHDLTDATILIRHGLITRIGDRRSTPLPAGIRVVDGTGQFAVPGLIDGFGALRTQTFADAYLYEGVTSVYVVKSPLGGDGEQTIVQPDAGPRLLLGVTIGGTSPDGSTPATHPWADDPRFQHPLSNSDLTAEVDAVAARGARGVMIGLDVRPSQVTAILPAAKRRGLATAGEFALTTYPQAIAAGVSTLVRNDHYLTALASPDVLQAYAEDPTGKPAGPAFRAVCRIEPGSEALNALGGRLRHAATTLMPVLAIEATADDVGAPNPWLSRSSVFVTPADLDDPVDPQTNARPYLDSHPDRREALQDCARHRQAADRSLHAQGVTYLAGSGATAYGIMPGGGLHQELRLMQMIGLTPREALATATSNFADAYGWRDIGRIERGRAADLVLIGQDPRLDVSALDDIRLVVHDGRIVDRDALISRAKMKKAETSK